MKIRFLGTGGAFEPEYFNSAAILQLNQKNILLDCGFTVYPRLKALHLISEVDYILLTHLHNDHCGSLPTLLLHQYFHGQEKKITILYQSEAFKDQIQQLLTIQLKDPAKYCSFEPLASVAGIRALDTWGRHSEGFQTYSFLFEAEAARIVYSGDLQDAPFLFNHLDILPTLPTTVFHDITFEPDNKGHTYYKILMAYQNRYKIFGYHCNPTETPPDNTIPLVFNQPELMF